jgi:hypothetical protein
MSHFDLKTPTLTVSANQMKSDFRIAKLWEKDAYLNSTIKKSAQLFVLFIRLVLPIKQMKDIRQNDYPKFEKFLLLKGFLKQVRSRIMDNLRCETKLFEVPCLL